MIGWRSEPRMGENDSPLWLRGVALVFLAGIGALGLWTAESVAVGAAVLGFVSGAALMIADRHVEVPALAGKKLDPAVKWPLILLAGGLVGVLDPLERIGAVLGATDAQVSGFAVGFIAGVVVLVVVYTGYARRTRRPAPA